MVIVKKKKGESDQKLISRFRQKTFDAGVVDEAKERRFHKKKSEEKKVIKDRNRYRDQQKRLKNKEEN